MYIDGIKVKKKKNPIERGKSYKKKRYSNHNVCITFEKVILCSKFISISSGHYYKNKFNTC